MRALSACYILSLLAVVGCGTTEWMEVKCPEEHVATRIPRDPASTYRHYGSVYESGYRATQRALDALIPMLSAGDSLRSIATDFKNYLVGERAAVEAQMEQTVSRLEENPCDTEARTRFQYLIEYVNFNGSYLHKIPAACKDSSANLKMVLEDYRRERN